MYYIIAHTTVYQYTQPVGLGAHTLRLRPRSDGSQHLHKFSLHIQPEPTKQTDVLDLEGNACLQVWFSAEPVTQLEIHTIAEVETFRVNPFDYLVEPWAITLPLDYPSSMAAKLHPYLHPPRRSWVSASVVDLAHTLMHEVEGNVSFFLTHLTQYLYKHLAYEHRPTGIPQPPAVTLATRSGSCRDFTVLFMALCQVVGLAARFVSGYQEGDLEQDNRELHAWPEVYVPGGGWRGFDPTHGLTVSDRHIALASAAFPADAAPVSGILTAGSTHSTLSYRVHIQALNSPSSTLNPYASHVNPIP